MGKETIEIERLGPYGVLAGGEWYGLDKKSGLEPDDFEQGKSYDVLVNQAESGKKYIKKKVVGESNEQEKPPQISKPAQTGAKTSSGYNSQETAERIVRQGVYQAVAQSPAVVPFVLKKEDIVPVVREVAEALIKEIKGMAA